MFAIRHLTGMSSINPVAVYICGKSEETRQLIFRKNAGESGK